jgi:hypothetical protein
MKYIKLFDTDGFIVIGTYKITLVKNLPKCNIINSKVINERDNQNKIYNIISRL